jgi:hypothetical protein
VAGSGPKGVPSARGSNKPSSGADVGHVNTKGGGTVERGANGNATYHGPNNTTAHFAGNKVTEARRGPTEIRRPGGGPRTVTEVRGTRTVVAHAGGHGYVQRPVFVGGQRLVQRTYYVGGHAYVQAYRPYAFNGASLYFFAPGAFYPAGYYGWMLDPWADPVDYPWGWSGAPWFGHFGMYFRPWGVYTRPSMWLTDFLVASTLHAAFDARVAENAALSEPIEEGTPLSDDVKAMVEEEVREQIAEERVEAGNPDQSEPGLPPSLTDGGSHLFLAQENLEVQNSSGATCVIGDGDAIQMKGGLPDQGTTANVVVLASKGSNCPAGSTVAVQVPDLIEMRNGMREKVELGLEKLRMEQGTDNLPALPAEFTAAPAPTLFSASLRPDNDAITLITEEVHKADQIERDILGDAGAALLAGGVPGASMDLSGRIKSRDAAVAVPRPAPEPVDDRESRLLAGIQIGQSESEVTGIMGAPLRTSFLGGVKKQYEYNSGKIIFTDGDVSDVQINAGVRTAEFAVQQPEQGATATTLSATPAPLSSSGRNVAQGQSESEVITLLGQPSRVSFLGGLKKMYEYGDRKIVFTDGLVTDVQK